MAQELEEIIKKSERNTTCRKVYTQILKIKKFVKRNLSA